MASELTGATTELLQSLIRNECVNDGTPDSGREDRNARLLEDYLDGSGIGIEQFESRPGRGSVVARIEGTDPDAPTLMLMGHTDVVPVNPDGWSRDPFGADVADGFVWGRGAIDMLNLTPSQAGPRLPVLVAEKGTFWTKIRIGGTAGHGSQPFRTDNALVTAAEVVRRLAEHRGEPRIHEVWRRFISSMGYPDEITEPLLSPEHLDPLLEGLPLGMARQFHACTHTTFAPTVIRGGTKTNVIPDAVDIEVDVRTLPGQSADE